MLAKREFRLDGAKWLAFLRLPMTSGQPSAEGAGVEVDIEAES